MTTSISSEAQKILERTNRQSELEGRYQVQIKKREKMQKLKKKSRNPKK